MRNYKQTGDLIPVIAPYDVDQGAGVLVGNLFGLATAAQKSGEALNLLCKGEFYVAKNSAEAWSVGDKVYWDKINKCFTIGPGLLVGLASEAVASPSATGSLLLMQQPGLVDGFVDPVTGEIRNSTGPTNAPFAGVQLCAAFGDSITANGVQAGAGFLRYSATGFSSWLQALSMGRLWFPLAMVHGTSVPTINYNKGVSGQTTADMLLRLTDITNLSPNPRFVTVLAGTNDLGLLPSDSAETVFARWKTIADTFIAAGIIPICNTILPRAVWSGLTAPQIVTARAKLLKINNYIRAYAAVRPSVILADAWQQTVNFASATSDPISAYFADNLHPNDLGGYIVGNVNAQAVDKWLSAQSLTRFAGPADVFDATNNPYGAFYDSSWAAGGGTALTGVTASGNGVPLGWTASRGSGATSSATIAQRSRADGVNGFEALYTLTGLDTAVFRLYSSTPVNAIVPTASFTTGDAFYGECESLFSGTGVNGNPDLYIQASDSSLFSNALFNSGTDVPGTYNLLLRTPLVIQPATLKAFQMWSLDGVKNGGATTVIHRNHVMRKYNKVQLNSVL